MSDAFGRVLRRAKIPFQAGAVVAAVISSGPAFAAVCADFNGRTVLDQDGNVVTFTQVTDSLTLNSGEQLTFVIGPAGGGPSDWLLQVDGAPRIVNPATTYILVHPGGAPVTFAINAFLHEARLTVSGTCNAPIQDNSNPVPRDRIFFSYQGFAATRPFFDGVPGMSPEALPQTRIPFASTLEDLDGGEGNDNVFIDAGLPPLSGGVRVVIGDLDGNDPIIVRPGLGGGPRVAVADVNGDGTDEVIVDPNSPPLSTGVRVLIGDVDRDGLIVSPGPGGGPRVAVADVNGDGVSEIVLEPGLPPFSGGVRVGVGDLNGDGNDAIIVNPLAPLRPGVLRVAVADVNGDGIADAIIQDTSGRVRVVSGDSNGQTLADFIPNDGSGSLMRYAGDDPAQAAAAWNSLRADQPIGGLPDFVSEHHATLGGLPVNIWGRLKGTILDGSLDRSGAIGAAQFGVTLGVTPSTDIGIVGHLTAGKVKSGTLNSEVDSFAGGVGAYIMSRLQNGMRLGASTSHSWGSHDLVLGGVTGRFGSSYWTADASAAMPFRVGAIVLTPMALATWRQISLGAYTASNGLAIPAFSDSTFALSGVIDLAYPMALDGPVIVALTPRVNVRTNVYLKKAETLILGPGITLESSTVTVDVAAGLSAAFANGGSADLLLGVTGLAGDVQSYSARLGLRIPLN